MKTENLMLSGLFLLVISTLTMAYPSPAVVQKIDQWTLDVVYSQPEQITVKLNDKSEPTRFWYIILTVTNNSTVESVEFFPLCRLVTDTFQTIPADQDVPNSVFEVIKHKHQGSYPFLESLDFKDHRIFHGDDNARDFVIIWPDFEPKAKEVSLFIGGLSNETAVIEHPALKDENGNPKKIFLQKTLQLKYSIAGDPKLRANTAMKEIEQDWVMR